MSIIPKQNPVSIDETYDIWHVLEMVIQTMPNQQFALTAAFTLVRDTGEDLTKTVEVEGEDGPETEEVPLPWIDGTNRKKYKEHPDKPRVTMRIPDLIEHIMQEVGEGDTEWLTLFEAVQAKLVQTAIKKGLIDVAMDD